MKLEKIIYSQHGGTIIYNHNGKRNMKIFQNPMTSKEAIKNIMDELGIEVKKKTPPANTTPQPAPTQRPAPMQPTVAKQAEIQKETATAPNIPRKEPEPAKAPEQNMTDDATEIRRRNRAQAVDGDR